LGFLRQERRFTGRSQIDLLTTPLHRKSIYDSENHRRKLLLIRVPVKQLLRKRCARL
jgi:hypothetical protein